MTDQRPPREPWPIPPAWETLGRARLRQAATPPKLRPATARVTAYDCVFSCSLEDQSPSKPWSGDPHSWSGVPKKPPRRLSASYEATYGRCLLVQKDDCTHQ